MKTWGVPGEAPMAAETSLPSLKWCFRSGSPWGEREFGCWAHVVAAGAGGGGGGGQKYL